MIKYKNGSKDIFNNQRNNKTSSNEIAKPNVNACSHENDTLEFVNNKFLIKCKECDAIIDMYRCRDAFVGIQMMQCILWDAYTNMHRMRNIESNE